MISINIIQGPQGCGKTTLMRDEALKNPGLYIFSCPSIELIREQVDWLRQNSPNLPVHEAHSDSKGCMSIGEKIDHAKAKIDGANAAHAFIFITHEGLMIHDFKAFNGWHARIDEAPASLQSGVMKVKLSKGFIQEKVKSEMRDGDWGYYTATQIIKWTEAERDTMANKALSFLKQANRPTGIFINEKALAENDEFVWFSFWSPTSLKNFDSIHISASSYTTSLGYIAAKQFYGDQCQFTEQYVPVARIGQPTIEIAYMTEAHAGSTSFWDSVEYHRKLTHLAA